MMANGKGNLGGWVIIGKHKIPPPPPRDGTPRPKRVGEGANVRLGWTDALPAGLRVTRAGVADHVQEATGNTSSAGKITVLCARC